MENLGDNHGLAGNISFDGNPRERNLNRPENRDFIADAENRTDSPTGADLDGTQDGSIAYDPRDPSVLAKRVRDADRLIRWATAERYRAVQLMHDGAREDAEVEIAARTAAEAASTADKNTTQRSRRGRRLIPSEIREFAERSFLAELACAIGEHEMTARSLASYAEVLAEQLPETLYALAGGDITVRQTQDLVDQSVSLPGEMIPEFEQAALVKAVGHTSSRFRHTVRKLRERMHPESITIRKQAAHQERRIDWAPVHDGMAWLNLYLKAENATGIRARLAAHAEELASYEDETRTKTQLELDVAADLLLNGSVTTTTASTATTASKASGTMNSSATDGAAQTITTTITTTGKGDGPAHSGSPANSKPAHATGTDAKNTTSALNRVPRTTVHVTVPVLTLMGLSEEPAELEGYGPISPETAKTLCAGATSFYRILTHPITGAYLSVGRESYRPPADLKRFLEVRDKTCRFPGCSRAVQHCDVDHTVDWAEGGVTAATNLSHLCRNHHRLKHETSWNVTGRPDGELVWKSPAGISYTTNPEYPEPVPLSDLVTGSPPKETEPPPEPTAALDLWSTPAGPTSPDHPAPF